MSKEALNLTAIEERSVLSINDGSAAYFRYKMTSENFILYYYMMHIFMSLIQLVTLSVHKLMLMPQDMVRQWFEA